MKRPKATPRPKLIPQHIRSLPVAELVKHPECPAEVAAVGGSALAEWERARNTPPGCPFCPDLVLIGEDMAVDADGRVCHAECLAEAKRQADDIAYSDRCESFWGGC